MYTAGSTRVKLQDYLKPGADNAVPSRRSSGRGGFHRARPAGDEARVMSLLFSAGVACRFCLGRRGVVPRGRYRVVGEAYCNTVMDGEALGMGLEERTFTLV